MEVNITYTTGYAGTGKSTHLLNTLKGLNTDTAVVIAPTHKALDRLRGHIDDTQEIKTIHSLLGWIPTINEEAKHISHIESTYKLNKPLEAYTDIVIDEAGMMSEDMLFDIVGKLDILGYDENGNIIDANLANSTVNIHLYLDQYQLLPVKGIQIQVDDSTTTRLTTQYRSTSLDVVALYTKFVDYLAGDATSLHMPIQPSELYSTNIRKFNTNEFKPGDRLLAYTNKAVGAWNKHLASKLGITSFIGQEVQLGNMLDTVIVDAWHTYSGVDEILADFKSEKLRLQNSNISTRFLEASLHALISHKNIQFIVAQGYVYPVIVGTAETKNILNNAYAAAIKNKKMFKHVYTLGRAFSMDYTFATTVHKSQGSEFENVFIDAHDIAKAIRNEYYDTYARLMYVGISRCINTLYI